VKCVVAFLVICALGSGGCSFVPKAYPRLEEARDAHLQAAEDPRVARHASGELKAAGEVLQRAITARATLDDPAVVDHLAYLAKQRAIISIETAQLKALEMTRARLIAVK